MGKVLDARGNEYDLDALYRITPAHISSVYREPSYIGKVTADFDFAYNDVEEIEDAKIGTIKRQPPQLEFGHVYSFVLLADGNRAVGIWHGSEVGFACGPVYVTKSEIDCYTIKRMNNAL